MGRNSRKSELLDHLTGDGAERLNYDQLSAELPDELRWLPGESAKQYRERVAPLFTQHLMARAVVDGDSKAMELVTSLLMKDMDNQVKLMQIVGPNGIVKQMAMGGADALRELSGTGSIPSAAAGIAAGMVRPSDLAAGR